MRRRPALVAALATLAVAATVAGQTATTVSVEREDAVLRITNQVQASEGGRSYLNLPDCTDEEGVRSTIFYGPPDGVETLVNEDTRIRSSLVILHRPAGGDGSNGETLELLDATPTFASEGPPCVVETSPADPPQVRLEQGRTTVSGARLFLDRESDVARMDGPVALERAPTGDGETVRASAEALELELGSERSVLTGNVRVEAGERVSEAESLELDEGAGIAVLRGSPARSRQGDNVLEGRTLLYYLDSNDVVVEGEVRGTLELERR